MVLFVSVPKRSATWVSALTEMAAIQNNGDDTWKLFAQMRQGVFPVSSWFYLLFPRGFLFRILPISFIQQLAQLKIINLFNFIDQLWVFFGPPKIKLSFFCVVRKNFHTLVPQDEFWLTFKSMRDKYLSYTSKVPKVQFIVAKLFCQKLIVNSPSVLRFLMNKHFLCLTIPETNRPINREQLPAHNKKHHV